ncbi:MAG: hypothetical protein JXA10_05230, partial [Anaerolineae bacterium]|nr:hypothetical protein [Anaerolineae bacterium]
MAETITLRAYLNDLNEMLERGGSAEVVSHCRYILQRFPQNIDTYRLLAQALLQRGHNEGTSSYFNEAAEVFQRVLSVVPNDYVAHFGLSEIRAQDGELDRAIWHMERAYEQLPGNQVLQDALRELYGKRDGEEHAPAKIQLTRGALARQYVNGQLYDQALIELRNALHQDANRIDLEVMLAETLWESQHPVEAGEAAVRILKKLPNSLAANRILARLWLENERPADAQRFLERLEALDPYLAADVLQPDTEVYDTITIDRLDYNAQAQAALSQETPDWVQELGGMEMGNVFSLDEPIASDEAGVSEESPETVQFDAEVPDWFAGVDSNLGATAPDTVDADADAMPWDSADWLTGGADQLTSNSPAQFQDEEASPADIPDWFIDSIGPEPEPASSSPRAATPLDADWLLGDDEAPTFGEAEANADDFAAMFDDLQTETPAASDPDLADLDADWLMDGADEGSDFATMFTADDDADQLDESTASESASITSDWLSDEEADQLVDYATMFDAIQTNDQPDEPVESADRLSGDTDDASDFAAMFTADDDVDQPDEADALEPAATADWLFGNDDEVSDFAAMFDAAADSEQPAEADTFEPAATADWLVGDEVSDFATMFDTADETEQPDEAAVSESADWLADDVDEVSDFAAMF